jgi:Flp pilus assembly protein TadG
MTRSEGLGKKNMLDRFMSSCRKLRNLARDRRGVAAVEFAFIAPVLLSLYFVTMEVSQGIETNKKVGRVASMVADLITQQQSVDPSTIDAIMKIGGAILHPYNRSQPTIEITAIQMSDDNNPQAEVVWSRRLHNGTTEKAAEPGTPVTVPANLRTPNSFLIRVSGQLDYRPVITWTADKKANLGLAAAFDSISMNETYYLRPRMSPVIPCDTC